MNPSKPIPLSSPPPPKRSGNRLLLFLAIAVVLAALAFWPGRGAPRQADIPEGATAHAIARQLTDAGVLQSRYPFLVWVKLRGASSKIHAGRYRFLGGRSAFWIVNDLIAGHTEKARVVIPEGWASWQIAERLEAEGVCPATPFRQIVMAQHLEGYLFPATYEFEVALAPATAAARLKARFEQVWTAEMDARAKMVGMTRDQVVTLASIVEREVRARDEGPMIAAVYLNRLHRGMRLDADPTVQYALGGWKTRLTYSDYRNTNSPYNTYLNAGLPPGPICSPGLDSLKAALWPAQSDALYFVAGDDGHHLFSSSYREHVNRVNHRNRLRRAAGAKK